MNQNQMQQSVQKAQLYPTFRSTKTDVEYEIQQNTTQKNKVMAFQKFCKPQLLFQGNQNVSISIRDNNLMNIKKQTKTVQFKIDGQLKDSIKYKKEKFIKHMEFEEDEELSEYSQEIIVKVEPNENVKSILKPVQKLEKQIIKIDQGKQTEKIDQKVFQQKIAQYRYGVGLTFLQKFGFEFNSGLGKEQDGILEPIEIKMQDSFTRKKIKIFDVQEGEIIISDSKTLEVDDEQNKKQQFKKYLLYLNQEEVILTQNGLDMLLLNKFQECYNKFKSYFIEYNLLGLLINKCEQKIKLCVQKWAGPENDCLMEEFSLISKTINFAKQVIQGNSNSLRQAELFTLQSYIRTLVNPIVKALKCFKRNYDFLDLWCRRVICVVSVDNQISPLELSFEKTMQEIMNSINQNQITANS